MEFLAQLFVDCASQLQEDYINAYITLRPFAITASRQTFKRVRLISLMVRLASTPSKC